VREVISRITFSDFMYLLYWQHIERERDMGDLNIIVDADCSPSSKFPYHNEVRISFGFPGCGCVITEIALFPEHISEVEAVERMLQKCDGIIKSRPFCPKCGHGLQQIVGAA